MSKEAEAREASPPSTFERLASINVNEYGEKKNGLSYVSWAWAVDQLLRQDPTATWEYLFWDNKPYCPIDSETMLRSLWTELTRWRPPLVRTPKLGGNKRSNNEAIDSEDDSAEPTPAQERCGPCRLCHCRCPTVAKVVEAQPGVRNGA